MESHNILATQLPGCSTCTAHHDIRFESMELSHTLDNKTARKQIKH
jgi:hypothetical protein